MKKVNWFSAIFSLLLLLPLSYIDYLFPYEKGSLLLTGLFGLLVCVFSSAINLSAFQRDAGATKLRDITLNISLGTDIAAAIITAVTLLFGIKYLTGPFPDVFQRVTIPVVQITLLTILAYNLFCGFLIWIRYKVPVESIVVSKKGKIYYPGSEVWDLPFTKYELVEKKQDINLDNLYIACKNGVFLANVKTSVELNIKEAQRLNISRFDKKVFMDKALETINEAMKARGENADLGDVINLEDEITIPTDFPAVWRNSSVYSIEKAD
jgi:hypothetical protein